MWEMLPVALSVIGTVMGTMGSYSAGDAAATVGRRQKAADEFQAAQMTQQAGQVFAASQRTQLEQVRRGTLLESRAQALTAASGSGGENPINIIANIHAEAAYRGGVALYGGEEQRRQLLMGAEAKRYEGALAEESGNAKRDAAYISGSATLFKGVSSLYSNYGGGGPKAPVADRTFDSTSSIGTGGINWDII